MTIKSTNRSSVSAIEKDLTHVRLRVFEHMKEVREAQEKCLDAEKKQEDAALDDGTYDSAKAKKKIEELERVVWDCQRAEKRADRNVEACRKRVTGLEEALLQAKQREIKAKVKKYGKKLTQETPGIEKLLENFIERVNEIKNSIPEVEREISGLGSTSSFLLREHLTRTISDWAIHRLYHLFPNQVERPDRAPDRSLRGSKDLTDSLEELFESVVNDSRLTKISSPFIRAEGLDEIRVTPVKEKLRGEAEELRREAIPA